MSADDIASVAHPVASQSANPPPMVDDMQLIATLRLSMYQGPNGRQVMVNANPKLLENWPLCYDMIDGGKKIIKDNHEAAIMQKHGQSSIQVAPAEVLNHLPALKR